MPLITNPADLRDAISLLRHAAKQEPLMALDTETFNNGKQAPPALIRAKTKDGGSKAFLDPYSNRIRLVQLKGRNTPAILVDLLCFTSGELQPLIDFLNEDWVTWVIHNAKFDWKILKVDLGIRLTKVYCTLTAGYMMGYATGITPRRDSCGMGLSDFVRDLLQEEELDKTEQKEYWGGELSESKLRYAEKDIAYLIPLYDRFVAMFASPRYNCSKAVDLEMRTLPAVAQMELNGICLDLWMYRLVQRCAKAALPGLLKELCQYFGIPMQQGFDPATRTFTLRPAGFNFNSDQQVKQLLNSKGIPAENMQEETLKGFEARFPIVRTLIQYNQLTKQLSVDYESFISPVTGRIHASFNQNGAATARFACQDPNLQQVPKLDVPVPQAIIDELEREGLLPRIAHYNNEKRGGYFLNYRYCIVPPPGWKLVSADFSGQEISVMVALARDPFMISIMNEDEFLKNPDGSYKLDEKGKKIANLAADLHSQAAAVMFKIKPEQARECPPQFNGKSYRDLAKAVVFGLAYGKSAKSLAEEWGIPEAEAEAIVEAFFRPMLVLKAWLEAQEETGMKTRLCRFGYGRLRFLNDLRHSDKKAAGRAARNTPIQGNSALMIKESDVSLYSLELQNPDTFRLVANIHDEALYEVRDDAVDTLVPLARQAMLDAASLFLCDDDGKVLVPGKIGVGVGMTWNH
jgi:DNA polymerase I-like protein with 3'-5' exonuclease and polymerase domains